MMPFPTAVIQSPIQDFYLTVAQEMLLVFDFFFSYLFLFLAVLCLHCCVRVFSSCSEQGLLFVVVRGLLIAVASLVAEHRL